MCLTAGLNPYALSMLLMCLSLTIEARWPAACFLAAKFACYLLIGFGLTRLQRFNPRWPGVYSPSSARFSSI